MKIVIDCKVDISEEICLVLVGSLFKNRKPNDGDFNYTFESHGVFENTPMNFPIHVMQTNDRKTNKSPIHLKIEKHKLLF